MRIKCNFGDAEKIRNMLKREYPFSNFDVTEIRNPWASLNDIDIYESGRILLTLEFSSDGYLIKNPDKYLLLEFVGDICECLAEQED